MHKHTEEMVDIHLEIETETCEALRQMHPGYGERSRIIRKLLRDYLAEKSTDEVLPND